MIALHQNVYHLTHTSHVFVTHLFLDDIRLWKYAQEN